MWFCCFCLLYLQFFSSKTSQGPGQDIKFQIPTACAGGGGGGACSGRMLSFLRRLVELLVLGFSLGSGGGSVLFLQTSSVT